MKLSITNAFRRNLACTVASMLVAGLALAQPVSDTESDTPTRPSPAEVRPDTDWSLQAGLLFVRWPVYRGADLDETVVYPLFTLEYKERFFVDTIEGISVHLLTQKPYSLDVGIAFEPGRAEDDSRTLMGLGDIDDGPVLKLKAAYEQGPLAYSASIERSVSGNDTGYWLDLEASYTHVLFGNLAVAPAFVARYGSKDYAQRHFGVSRSQSADSGLDQYDPGSGFATAGVQLSVSRVFLKDWMWQGKIKWERLVGDAADSPVVSDKNQVTLALGIVYQFR